MACVTVQARTVRLRPTQFSIASASLGGTEQRAPYAVARTDARGMGIAGQKQARAGGTSTSACAMTAGAAPTAKRRCAHRSAVRMRSAVGDNACVRRAGAAWSAMSSSASAAASTARAPPLPESAYATSAGPARTAPSRVARIVATGWAARQGATARSLSSACIVNRRSLAPASTTAQAMASAAVASASVKPVSLASPAECRSEAVERSRKHGRRPRDLTPRKKASASPRRTTVARTNVLLQGCAVIGDASA